MWQILLVRPRPAMDNTMQIQFHIASGARPSIPSLESIVKMQDFKTVKLNITPSPNSVRQKRNLSSSHQRGNLSKNQSSSSVFDGDTMLFQSQSSMYVNKNNNSTSRVDARGSFNEYDDDNEDDVDGGDEERKSAWRNSMASSNIFNDESNSTKSGNKTRKKSIPIPKRNLAVRGINDAGGISAEERTMELSNQNLSKSLRIPIIKKQAPEEKSRNKNGNMGDTEPLLATSFPVHVYNNNNNNQHSSSVVIQQKGKKENKSRPRARSRAYDPVEFDAPTIVDASLDAEAEDSNQSQQTDTFTQTQVLLVSNYIDLMKKCWSQDPDDRPDSRELVEKLKELFDS